MTRPGHDAATLARLEAAAARNPALYRARLAVLAVAGDVALTAALVLPWAFLPLIGVLLFNHPIFYALGAVVLIFLVWLVRPSVRIGGRLLRPTDVPLLAEAVDGLARRLQVAGRTELAVDELFNAGATESRGVFGLIGTRRVLTLGVPLLAVLDRQALLAVVAHELGHFSRRHGRLGHWLYQARVGWIAYRDGARDSGPAFERAAAWYAERFVPYFSIRCFVHARRCEYEADADAAFAVDSRSLAAALTRVAVLDPVWQRRFPALIAQQRGALSEPPGDYLQQFAAHVQTLTPEEAAPDLAAALQAPSSAVDTHPRLADRLAALREAPVLYSHHESAGEALLGAAWPGLLAAYSARWVQANRAQWTFDHLRLKHFAPPAAADDGLDRQLARARAVRLVDPAAGLAALAHLRGQHRDDDQVAFAYAAALLSDDDAAGAPIMEELAKRMPPLRQPAYVRLLAYAERTGDVAAVERWSAHARTAARRRADAIEAFWDGVSAGRVGPSGLSADVQQLLADLMAHDATVAGGCLLEGGTAVKSRTGATETRAHGLVLTLDPAEMARRGDDEDAVAVHYEDALATLVPPGEIATVRSYLATEPMPTRYAAAAAFVVPIPAATPSDAAMARA